ncbi:MAG: HAD family hydrolase [Candidatus Nanopelagicales bacterium]
MPRGSRPVAAPLLLLDLDGTLVDHDAAELTAITGWMRDAGFPSHVDGAATESVWRGISEDVFSHYFAGRLGFQEQRRIRVRTFLPLVGVDVSSATDDDLDVYFDEYGRRYAEAWQPFPDVVDCLTRLRDTHRLAILTNGDQGHQEGKVRRVGLEGLVESTIATSSLGAAKPDPAAFLGALDRLGVQPEDATYVGDRLDVDALGAQSAGLTGVWLDRADAGGAPAGVRRITTLAELP